MYKAKVAVFFRNPYKTLNAKQALCRVFECLAWWYVEKTLGFKRLMEQYYVPMKQTNVWEKMFHFIEKALTVNDSVN
jgi:hypothetical protein